MARGKSEPKRNLSGLERVSTECSRGAVYTRTVYLFSVTGNAFVERRNFLTEFHYAQDDPGCRDSSGKFYEWGNPHKKGDYAYGRFTESAQKLLCIGGPLAGSRSTGAEGYESYNAGTNGRGRDKAPYRCVFVHKSLLKG